VKRFLSENVDIRDKIAKAIMEKTGLNAIRASTAQEEEIVIDS